MLYSLWRIVGNWLQEFSRGCLFCVHTNLLCMPWRPSHPPGSSERVLQLLSAGERDSPYFQSIQSLGNLIWICWVSFLILGFLWLVSELCFQTRLADWTCIGKCRWLCWARLLLSVFVLYAEHWNWRLVWWSRSLERQRSCCWNLLLPSATAIPSITVNGTEARN